MYCNVHRHIEYKHIYSIAAHGCIQGPKICIYYILLYMYIYIYITNLCRVRSERGVISQLGGFSFVCSLMGAILPQPIIISQCLCN